MDQNKKEIAQTVAVEVLIRMETLARGVTAADKFSRAECVKFHRVPGIVRRNIP